MRVIAPRELTTPMIASSRVLDEDDAPELLLPPLLLGSGTPPWLDATAWTEYVGITWSANSLYGEPSAV